MKFFSGYGPEAARPYGSLGVLSGDSYHEGERPAPLGVFRESPCANASWPNRRTPSSARSNWEVAVLPFGATEPHNLHMPYGTDNFQVEEHRPTAPASGPTRPAPAWCCCRRCPSASTPTTCKCPAAWRAASRRRRCWRLLTDLVDSLERQGVRKLVLLNGHGGNELKPLTRELHHRTKVFLCVCDWFRMAADLYPEHLRAARRTRRRGGDEPGAGVLPGADAAGAGRRRGGAADRASRRSTAAG